MDIIYISYMYWYGMRHRHQQLAKALAGEHRILFVDSPRNIGDWLRGSRWREPRGLNRIEAVPGELYHLPAMPSLPFKNSIGFINDSVYRQVRRRVEQAASHLGFTDPAIWLNYPGQYLVYDAFPGSLKCFDWVDDYVSLMSICGNGRLMKSWEMAVMARVDLAFVTHPKLLEDKGHQVPEMALVPNAADYDHFNAASAVPTGTLDNRPVIVGYFGDLEWLDWELIREVSSRTPGYQYVFIGPKNGVIPPELPANIELTGYRPYDELPALMAGWSLCWIPFRDCETIRHTNPIKIYEYLASGKPALVTKAIRFDNPLVFQAATAPEYLEGIERCLHDDTPEKARQRQDYAKQNSWASRAAQISVLLRSAAARRRGKK